jgi:hypothetical protein
MRKNKGRRRRMGISVSFVRLTLSIQCCCIFGRVAEIGVNDDKMMHDDYSNGSDRSTGTVQQSKSSRKKSIYCTYGAPKHQMRCLCACGVNWRGQVAPRNLLQVHLTSLPRG